MFVTVKKQPSLIFAGIVGADDIQKVPNVGRKCLATIDMSDFNKHASLLRQKDLYQSLQEVQVHWLIQMKLYPLH